MANELKPMLMKVLTSKGKKKFFFAYGAGKRKDGSGDGEFVVSGKKLTKAEVAGQLTEVKGFYQGVCWLGQGPDFDETVFFKGTGLSSSVVAKMALTARRLAGRQYDFQVPSEAEEQRAATLAEGEDDDQKPAEQSAGPEADTTKEPAAAGPEAAYQSRVKALSDGLKKALASKTPAGQEAGLRFSEAQTYAGKKDFPQAMGLLAVVEEQIRKALAGGGEAKGGDPAAAEWKAKLAEWAPAIKAALAAQGPNAAAVGKLLAQATALSKLGGDLAQALATLTACHALATGDTAADAGGETEAATDTAEARWTARRLAVEAPFLKAVKEQPANAGKLRAVLAFADGKAEAGDFAKALQGLDNLDKLLRAPAETNGRAAAALQQWQAACAEVKNQLRKFQSEIVNAKDVNSAKAVLRLESIVKNLAQQPATQQDVVEMERWLGDDELIALVETPNPWAIPITIRGPLLPVLGILKPQLPA